MRLKRIDAGRQTPDSDGAAPRRAPRLPHALRSRQTVGSEPHGRSSRTSSEKKTRGTASEKESKTPSREGEYAATAATAAAGTSGVTFTRIPDRISFANWTSHIWLASCLQLLRIRWADQGHLDL